MLVTRRFGSRWDASKLLWGSSGQLHASMGFTPGHQKKTKHQATQDLIAASLSSRSAPLCARHCLGAGTKEK